MKITYIILYAVSIILFLIAMLGSSLTKNIFTSYSEKTLEYSGLRKNSIQSIDNKIDDLVYKSKQIELKIEKIKNLFSSEEIDESKYQRENSALIQRSVYDPLVNLVNNIFRASLVFVSVIVLLFAVIVHIIYRSIDLRKRIRKLEAIVLAEKYN